MGQELLNPSQLPNRPLASSTASQTIQHTPASYLQRLYECFGGAGPCELELHNYGEFRHISLSSRQHHDDVVSALLENCVANGRRSEH